MFLLFTGFSFRLFQEALQENAQQQPELLQMKPQSHLQPNPAQIIIANCQPIQANASQQQQQQTNLLINCDQSNDLSSIRAPSSAASSGLGLSLEEDLSLKYCQSVLWIYFQHQNLKISFFFVVLGWRIFIAKF